jgi:hypothetical protein
MQDLLIEDLDDDLIRLLEEKAKVMGISPEEVARFALIEHVKDTPGTEADRQSRR